MYATVVDMNALQTRCFVQSKTILFMKILLVIAVPFLSGTDCLSQKFPEIKLLSMRKKQLRVKSTLFNERFHPFPCKCVRKPEEKYKKDLEVVYRCLGS
eukprot:bmy_07420T0